MKKKHERVLELIVEVHYEFLIESVRFVRLPVNDTR